MEIRGLSALVIGASGFNAWTGRPIKLTEPWLREAGHLPRV